MTTIEYLLNKMPSSFEFYKEEPCNCCNNLRKVYYKYNLQLEIHPYYSDYSPGKHIRYRLYYRLASYCTGNDTKIIGETGGLGYLTLKEALKALLAYKQEIRDKIRARQL